MEGSNTYSSGYNESKWCCKNSDEECLFDDDVTCKGKAISLKEPCTSQDNNRVCNYYPDDLYRAERSYVNIYSNE